MNDEDVLRSAARRWLTAHSARYREHCAAYHDAVINQSSPPNATSEADAAKYLMTALLYERTNAAAGAMAMGAMTAREDVEIARFRGMSAGE